MATKTDWNARKGSTDVAHDLTPDPRSKLGVPSPRHPITGEEKRNRSESVIGFARRHGWEVQEQADADFYYVDVILRKNGDRVTLSLWPGKSKSIALATINRVQLSQRWGFPTRERVEMYLAGVGCTCTVDTDLYVYEEKQDPSCRIHGEAS